MSGGILQLAARGKEDKFITGDPQITFFKTIYRRHTNYSRGEFDLKFESNLDFNREAVCKIQKFGDLLSGLYLVIVLPEVKGYHKAYSVGEIQKLLNTSNISWNTIKSSTELFTKDDYDTVKALINTHINKQVIELEKYNNISDYVTTHLSKDKFFEKYPTKDDNDVDDYYKFVIDGLMKYDPYYDKSNPYYIQYRYIDDCIDNIPLLLTNSDKLRDIMYKTLLAHVTQQDTSSVVHIDANLRLLHNIKTANYDIPIENISLLTRLNMAINNAYAIENFKLLDTHKIITNMLSDSSDIENIPSLIDTYKLYFNLKQSTYILKNVYDSLNDDYVYTFYKKNSELPTNNEVNSFTNISTHSDFDDKFTNVLKKNFDTEVYYQTHVNNAVDTFHSNNTSYFKTNKIIEYTGKSDLFTRIDINNTSHPYYTDIVALYGGTLPDTLKNIYFLNHIPILTVIDIPVAIQKVIGTVPVSLVTSLDIAQSELETLTNITNKFYDETNYPINEKIAQQFRDTQGVDADILMTSLIKHYMTVKDGDTYILITEYAAKKYIDVVNNDSNLSDDDKGIAIRVVNTFVTSIDDMPSYDAYVSNDYNMEFELKINDDHSTLLSDAMSSIFTYIMNKFIQNYNYLYNNEIVDIMHIFNNVGIENYTIASNIRKYSYGIDYDIPENQHVDIDYYNQTDHTHLPVNGGIMNDFILPTITKILDVISFYTKNEGVLNMKNIQLLHTKYYFEKFQTLLDMYVDIIESDNITYPHDPHDGSNDDVVIYVKNNIEDPASSYPHHTIVDAIINTKNKYDLLITSSTNPFDPTSQLYALWNDTWTPSKKFDESEEMTKYINLFGKYDPTHDPNYNENLYKSINIINTKYNGFVNETDVCNFMLDTIINTTIYGDIIIKKDTVTNTYIQITENVLKIITELEQDITNGTALYSPLEKTLLACTPAKFAWIHKIGHYIIDTISIYIGDQLVDIHNGEWLEIWHELTKSVRKEDGYKKLIGDVPELTTYDTTQKDRYELIIPLQFWFNKYIGTSIPLIALIHTEVRINVRLKPFTDCAYYEDDIVFVNMPKLHSHLIADYMYVENEERNLIAKSRQEFLIDVLQMNDNITVSYETIVLEEDYGLLEINAYFQNLCKEFVWVCQNLDFVNGTNGEKKWDNYGLDYDTGYDNPIHSVQIKFSGRDRESTKNSAYYNYIVPYEQHHATPSDGINVYSMSLKPELYQPSGTANLSQISQVAFQIRFSSTAVQEMKNGTRYRLALYATSYNILRIMSGLAGLAWYG